MEQAILLSHALWAAPDPLLQVYFEAMPPWDLLSTLHDIVIALGRGSENGYLEVQPMVWVHRTATLAPDVQIVAPAFIDAHATLRPGAYLRGNVYVGVGAIVGHCTEVKNSVLLAHSAAPHFNYVGDSILGQGAHLGAGAILSNLRHDHAAVTVHWQDMVFNTHRRKLGALIGDRSEIGCNAVLNPGTVLETGAIVHPLQSVVGYVAAKQKI